MPDDRPDYLQRGVHPAALLRLAGFEWVEPGYWSVRERHVELALEPQVLNAGEYKLQLYGDRMPLLAVEVLVDVKSRPGS